MATVKDLLEFTKNKEPKTIDKESSALDASKILKEENIGYLAVVNDEKLVGVLSERDIVFKVIAEGMDPGETTVESIYTSEVITCTEEENINSVLSKLKEHRIRHLPIVGEEDKLISVVSERDITAFLLERIEAK